MVILIYAFSAIFIFLAMVLLFTYHRTRHHGIFLLAVTYGLSAVLALVVMRAWPLLLGFIFAWVLRLMGMEPDTRDPKPPQE
jgi:hypothetical protein